MSNIIASANEDFLGKIFGTKLDRDFLVSNDPAMKRKIMAQIGILTRKMSQMAPHAYLAPQIDDELVYQYLRNCPKELEILNKWICYPNFKYLNILGKVADSLERFSKFDRSTTLYRGFHHSDKLSLAKQKYPQQRMGLTEIQTEGSVLKKPGNHFKYVIANPTSSTKDRHIANKFGTIIISFNLRNTNHKVIDINDSLVAAVFLNQYSLRIPVIRDHIKFLKEVLIIPTDLETEVDFTIKQSPVPLYYKPFNVEEFKKNPVTERPESLLVKLGKKIKGLEELESYFDPFETWNAGDPIDYIGDTVIAQEGQGWDVTKKVIRDFKDLAVQKYRKMFNKDIKEGVEFFTKNWKGYLAGLKKYEITKQEFTAVARTNSTNDIYPAKICVSFMKAFEQVIKFCTYVSTNKELNFDKLLEETHKVNKAIIACGFSNVDDPDYDVKKELRYKCTHGRVDELGYNLDNVTKLLEFYGNRGINDTFAVYWKVEDFVSENVNKLMSSHTEDQNKKFYDPETEEDIAYREKIKQYNSIRKVLYNAGLIMSFIPMSLANVMSRTYKPLLQYIKDNREQEKVEEAMEAFLSSVSEDNKKLIHEAYTEVYKLLKRYPGISKSFVKDFKDNTWKPFVEGKDSICYIGHFDIYKVFSQKEVDEYDDIDFDSPVNKYYQDLDEFKDELKTIKLSLNSHLDMNGDYEWQGIYIDKPKR